YRAERSDGDEEDGQLVREIDLLHGNGMTPGHSIYGGGTMASRYPAGLLASLRQLARSAKLATIVTNSGKVRMRVSVGMSEVVLRVGPDHTLREAAQKMAARSVGAAIVEHDEWPGPQILTE